MKEEVYFHSAFQVDGKKFKFKSENRELTEVKLKVKFPDQFKHLKAYFSSEDTIKIDFRGLSGCTLAENLEKSTSSITKNINVDLEGNSSIPSIIKVEFHLTEVDNCKQDNFVPETAGGGILVGTWGWFELLDETNYKLNG